MTKIVDVAPKRLNIINADNCAANASADEIF